MLGHGWRLDRIKIAVVLLHHIAGILNLHPLPFLLMGLLLLRCSLPIEGIPSFSMWSWLCWADLNPFPGKKLLADTEIMLLFGS